MKSLFSGKRKFLTIPIALLLGFIFLPITIGLLLTWFSYKKIGNKKMKYSVASVFALLTLFFGSAYVSALVSPTPKPEQVAQVQATPTEVLTSTPEPEVAAAQDEVMGADLVKVTRIIDGDTIELEGGQRVRYIGIDTPELSGNNPECYAREAYDKNRELVEGKQVRLEKDVSETDRYGRLLRYVYVDDNFINDLLVRTGYANASSYPPDIKYQDQFREAEKEARESNKGLWNSCLTITPKPTTKPTATPKQSSGGSQPAPTTPPQQNSGGSYSCNCSRTCTQISSCAEAQYQLNVCGCSQRDADDDGIACDGAPLNCQN